MEIQLEREKDTMNIKLQNNTKFKLINTETNQITMLENISKLKIIDAGDINRLLFETKTNSYDKVMCAKHLVIVSKDVNIKEEGNCLIIECLSHNILNRWLSNIVINNTQTEILEVTKFDVQSKLDELKYEFDVIEWNGLEKEVTIKCRECGKLIKYKKGKTVYMDSDNKSLYFSGYCNHIV